MRITGVDAARGLALLGMAAAHLHATTGPDGRATLVGDLVAGRASALFAVLAGVGVALGSRRAGAARGLVVRALLVGALGLGLESALDAPPAVILAQYGLLFLVALPLLRVPAPALFAAAAVWCVASPVLSHVLRAGMPDGPGPQPSFTMAPGELLVTLGLTGYYPVLTWITYLLVGIGIGRLELESPRTAWRLVGAGAALAVLALGTSALLGGGPSGRQRAGITPSDDWAWLLTAARHSGTPFDLAYTTGTALLVLGLCLLGPRLLVGVLAGPGAIPLTLYTAHVVVGGLVTPFGTAVWVAQAVVALVVGGLFRRAGRRGPLEAVVAAASGAVRRRVPAEPS